MTRDQLITENIALVWYTIKKHFYGYDKQTQGEFFEEGIFGLMQAADTFEENKNINFSSYAVKCIQRAILKYLKYLNADKRKDEIGTISLNQVFCDDDKDDVSLINILKFEEDYSTANCELILQLVEDTNIKHAKYIVLKRAEGYSFREIGESLGISARAVQGRLETIQKQLYEFETVNVLKTNKTGKKWTDEETNFLKLEYKNKGAKKVADELGRTVRAIENQANKLGLKKKAS